MNLLRYAEDDCETTPYTAGELAPYTADGEPTLEWHLSKSDAIWESRERMRLGNNEAAAEWLLIAGAL